MCMTQKENNTALDEPYKGERSSILSFWRLQDLSWWVHEERDILGSLAYRSMAHYSEDGSGGTSIAP